MLVATFCSKMKLGIGSGRNTCQMGVICFCTNIIATLEGCVILSVSDIIIILIE